MLDFWHRTIDNKEKVRYQQAKVYSPYCEASKNSIKEERGITYLSVNGFYRYSAIMEPLFAKRGVSEEHKGWLYDIYMHYLTILEWRRGINGQEYEINKIRKELELGKYGENIVATYELLAREDKYYIAHMLYQQQKTRESINKFSDVLVAVLKNGIVYKDQNQEKQILFYINSKENVKENDIINMICELFLPMGYELRVFRETHFGVFGEEQTMRIDEIELL